MAVLGSTSLTGCDSIPSFIAAGSLVTFQQTSAPTSWTKQTTHNDKALRVVTGSASSGGTTAFSSVMASRTPAGTVGNTTLTEAQIPSHSHNVTNYLAGSSLDGANSGGAVNVYNHTSSGNKSTDNTGGSTSHNHGFTGTALDFAVQYVDIIICSKN